MIFMIPLFFLEISLFCFTGRGLVTFAQLPDASSKVRSLRAI